MATVTATEDRPSDIIEAMLTYGIKGAEGEVRYNATYGPGGLDQKRGGPQETLPAHIRNGRPLVDQFELERHGFRFVAHHTEVKNFYDPEEVRRVYYAEMVALMKRETGATRVHIFDHTVRNGAEEVQQEKLIRGPVGFMHNDYTEWSGPQRVRDVLPDEAEELLKYRLCVNQVWRPINKPVTRSPLCITDARSIDFADLIRCERRYEHRVGETYQLARNPAHEYYYFPNMTRDEALVFKCYDSLTDGRARWTAHGAFELPDTPADAPPRESIEIRALVFFGPEG